MGRPSTVMYNRTVSGSSGRNGSVGQEDSNGSMLGMMTSLPLIPFSKGTSSSEMDSSVMASRSRHSRDSNTSNRRTSPSFVRILTSSRNTPMEPPKGGPSPTFRFRQFSRLLPTVNKDGSVVAEDVTVSRSGTVEPASTVPRAFSPIHQGNRRGTHDRGSASNEYGSAGALFSLMRTSVDGSENNRSGQRGLLIKEPASENNRTPERYGSMRSYENLGDSRGRQAHIRPRPQAASNRGFPTFVLPLNNVAPPSITNDDPPELRATQFFPHHFKNQSGADQSTMSVDDPEGNNDENLNMSMSISTASESTVEGPESAEAVAPSSPEQLKFKNAVQFFSARAKDRSLSAEDRNAAVDALAQYCSTLFDICDDFSHRSQQPNGIPWETTSSSITTDTSRRLRDAKDTTAIPWDHPSSISTAYEFKQSGLFSVLPNDSVRGSRGEPLPKATRSTAPTTKGVSGHAVVTLIPSSSMSEGPADHIASIMQLTNASGSQDEEAMWNGNSSTSGLNRAYQRTHRSSQVGTDKVERINQYAVLAELGKGSTGEVLLALNTETDKLHAIKVMTRPRERRQFLRPSNDSSVGDPLSVIQFSSSRHSSTIAGERSLPNVKGGNSTFFLSSPNVTPSPLSVASAMKSSLHSFSGVNGSIRRPSVLLPSKEREVKVVPLTQVEREIRIMRRLNHPGIVHLYEVIDDEENNLIMFVMDHLPKNAIASVRPYNPIKGYAECSVVRPMAKVAAYAQQIAAALRYMHRRRIVHNDIKPDNLLLSSTGAVVLIDFGESILLSHEQNTAWMPESSVSVVNFSHMAGANASVASPIEMAKFANTSMALFEGVGADGRIKAAKGAVGTPAFLAPEMAEMNECSRETDIWAFGVTLFAIICGRLPFAALTMRETVGRITSKAPIPFPPLSDIPDNDDLTEELYAQWKTLISSLMAYVPRKRMRLRDFLTHPLIMAVPKRYQGFTKLPREEMSINSGESSPLPHDQSKRNRETGRMMFGSVRDVTDGKKKARIMKSLESADADNGINSAASSVADYSPDASGSDSSDDEVVILLSSSFAGGSIRHNSTPRTPHDTSTHSIAKKRSSLLKHPQKRESDHYAFRNDHGEYNWSNHTMGPAEGSRNSVTVNSADEIQAAAYDASSNSSMGSTPTPEAPTPQPLIPRPPVEANAYSFRGMHTFSGRKLSTQTGARMSPISAMLKPSVVEDAPQRRSPTYLAELVSEGTPAVHRWSKTPEAPFLAFHQARNNSASTVSAVLSSTSMRSVKPLHNGSYERSSFGQDSPSHHPGGVSETATYAADAE